MAQNETDSGLFVALNYLSHLPLCLSEKIRRCSKSFDNFEKTSDFFRSLAGTDYHYCGVRLTLSAKKTRTALICTCMCTECIAALYTNQTSQYVAAKLRS